MELDKRLMDKVSVYKPDISSIKQICGTPILFLAGIVGAGKNTVQDRLISLKGSDYHIVVSHTTRKPRANNGVIEKDGVDYYFIDFETAERMLDEKAFVEAKVVHFDNIYGTSISEIAKAEDAHKIALNNIDVEGVKEYVNLGMNIKPIFLLPPSYDVWMERLLSRYEGKVHQHDLYKRLKTALAELEHAMGADYFYIVVNDVLDEAVDLVDRIAHGEAVEPHHHRAMAIAEQIAGSIRAHLATME